MRSDLCRGCAKRGSTTALVWAASSSGPVLAPTKARVWSCAFVNEDTGYFMLSMLAEPVEPADEGRAKSIFDATELTKLAEIGSMPQER